jgi:hypothetical protein
MSSLATDTLGAAEGHETVITTGTLEIKTNGT